MSISPASVAEAPATVPAAHPVTVSGTTETVLWLPDHLRSQLVFLVEATYPFEACGVMIGRAEPHRISVEHVFHSRNLNVERARDRFLLDPQDFMKADEAARECGLEIVGIWHSHPDHPARPSITDLEAAWEGYSYLIVSTTAAGANDFRSWRLAGGRFQEETVSDPSTEEQS